MSDGDGEGVALHSRGYVSLLLMAGALGIPISLVAFIFLVIVHQLERVVWHDLPQALGHSDPPAWWPVVTISVAGCLVALAIRHLPGRGGHVPVTGLGAGATPPVALPGVVLAATASLAGGAVVGPEAPLIAIGSGLALLVVRRTSAATEGEFSTILAASGSAAAISAIFGNPVVAAVIFLEVLGLKRRPMMLVAMPCLLSSGVGALIFTGLGRWTGLEIGGLTLPGLSPAPLTWADVMWTVPLAAFVALTMWVIHGVGRHTARLAESHLVRVTVGAGLLAGLAAGSYTLLTERSPTEIALSGQSTLPNLVGDPGSWTAWALVALLVCKSVAYAVCLGTFRGGLAFPAIFLGAALGVAATHVLPGLTMLSGVAIGMSAGLAVTGLPVTSVLLVVLLLGDAAGSQMPVAVMAVVTALVVAEMLTSIRRHRLEGPAAAPPVHHPERHAP